MSSADLGRCSGDRGMHGLGTQHLGLPFTSSRRVALSNNEQCRACAVLQLACSTWQV